MRECPCGFTCGSNKALARHLERGCGAPRQLESWHTTQTPQPVNAPLEPFAISGNIVGVSSRGEQLSPPISRDYQPNTASQAPRNTQSSVPAPVKSCNEPNQQEPPHLGWSTDEDSPAPAAEPVALAATDAGEDYDSTARDAAAWACAACTLLNYSMAAPVCEMCGTPRGDPAQGLRPARAQATGEPERQPQSQQQRGAPCMDSMFVHEHGVGAALRAVQLQLGAGYFASLQAEWERVLLECTVQR